jgi:hypothetical protein
VTPLLEAVLSHVTSTTHQPRANPTPSSFKIISPDVST